MAETKKKKTNQKTGNSSGKNAKQGAKKKAANSAAKKKAPRKSGPAVPFAVRSVIMAALGAFLIISMQTDLAGLLGKYTGIFLKGTFGLAGYVFPYLLIAFSVLSLFRLVKPVSTVKCLQLLGLELSLTLFDAARFVDRKGIAFADFRGVFEKGAELDNCGVLGMYIGTPVYKAAGTAGLLILAVALLLIFFILLSSADTRESIAEAVRRRTGKKKEKYDTVVIDAGEQKKAGRKTGRTAPDGSGTAAAAGAAAERTPVPGTAADRAPAPGTAPDRTPAPGTAAYTDRAGSAAYPAADTAGSRTAEVGRGTAPAARTSGSRPPKWGRRMPSNLKNILDLVYNEYEPDAAEDGQGFGLDVSETDLIRPAASAPAADDSPWSTALTGAAGTRTDVPGAVRGDDNGDDGPVFSPDDKILDHVTIGGESVATARSVTEDEEGEVRETKKTSARYKLPPLDLLKEPAKSIGRQGETDAQLNERAALLERTLASFNVEARVTNIISGPSVTRYELEPAAGVKVQRITSLSDDIALSMKAKSLRMEAPIPGKAAVGIEIENQNRQTVTLREMIGSQAFRSHKSKIAFAVGRDIGGNAVVADLEKMPHLLIAGTTGSGKSVCINTIIASILYKARPEEVKMILIDPKMVELSNYNGIPHLLVPVVDDVAKAAGALNWAVAEMMDRYKRFKENGVRDIGSFNLRMKQDGEKEEMLSQIVIIIDELSDLMMQVKSQVEDAICRIAQMGRAAGLHLIISTQSPRVDVITGLIKANIPSRIALTVASQIDSQTIIGKPGAEHLVGNGDMLFQPQDLNKPKRIQGPYVSDQEINAIIDHVRSQAVETVYDSDALSSINRSGAADENDDDDELLFDAIGAVVSAGQASVSMLQRRFRIGYNRAARIVDIMESKGIVGPQDGSRPRQILITQADYDKMKEDAGRII